MSNYFTNCKSPIEWLFTNVYNAAIAVENLSNAQFNALVEAILSQPNNITTPGVYCCPDCLIEDERIKEGFYIYAFGTLSDVFEIIYSLNEPLCCFNGYSSSQIFNDINSQHQDFSEKINKCCNTFNSCLKDFRILLEELYDPTNSVHVSLTGGVRPYQFLLDNGIAEYGTIVGNSMLCEIINSLSVFPETTGYKSGWRFIMLMRIILDGMVITCDYRVPQNIQFETFIESKSSFIDNYEEY